MSELGGATVKQRAQRNGLVVVSNHQRATAKPVLTPEATGACERYDRLWAWLHDHAGVVGERDNPLQAAGSYTERNVVSLEFQPQTRSVTVATGLRAAERPRWRLIWDPDQGVVRASPPDAPSRP